MILSQKFGLPLLKASTSNIKSENISHRRTIWAETPVHAVGQAMSKSGQQVSVTSTVADQPRV
jgi:hypothetical protein